MSRQALFEQLLQTVQRDLRDYPKMEACLEAQFAAALAHDAEGMRRCADQLGALCAALEESRRERRRLAAAVLLREHDLSMTALFALLPAAAREACERRWRQLLAHVERCRDLNLRNGGLLRQQQQVLARVLEGEAGDVYHAQ